MHKLVRDLLRQLEASGCEWREKDGTAIVTHAGHHVTRITTDGRSVDESIKLAYREIDRAGIALQRRERGMGTNAKELRQAQEHEARCNYLRRRINDAMAEGDIRPTDFARLAHAEGAEIGLRLPDSQASKDNSVEEMQIRSLVQSLQQLRSGKRVVHWTLDLFETALRALEAKTIPQEDFPQNGSHAPEPEAKVTPMVRVVPSNIAEPGKQPDDDMASLRSRFINELFEEKDYDRLERLLFKESE